MIALARNILILIVIYSLGFVTGMNYSGQDKSEALKDHLIEGFKEGAKQGQELIKKVTD